MAINKVLTKWSLSDINILEKSLFSSKFPNNCLKITSFEFWPVTDILVRSYVSFWIFLNWTVNADIINKSGSGLTAMRSSKGLSNILKYSSLMSPRSISDLPTMIRIRVLSLVPIPSILLSSWSAKNFVLFFTLLTEKKQ